MRPDFYGLRLAPSVPKSWESFTVEKDFRGNHLHIVVNNPNHAESGFRKLMVDGVEMKDNYIPAHLLKEQTKIVLDIS